MDRINDRRFEDVSHSDVAQNGFQIIPRANERVERKQL